MPSDGLPDLEQGELLLTDGVERLWRQVHPQFQNAGVVTSRAFAGGSDDPQRVSTAREARCTAADAMSDHLARGRRTVGTWAVTVGEVDGVGRRAVDDSALPDVPDDHAYIDLRGLDDRSERRVRRDLAAQANARGCVHAASTGG